MRVEINMRFVNRHNNNITCEILSETAKGWKVRQTETFANPRKQPKVTIQYYQGIWFDDQKGQWDEINNALLGIYAVKSPYHKEIYYLPFIVHSYHERDKTYGVFTLEYKGLTSYRVDTRYSEKSIREHIKDGTIIKKARPDNFRDDQDAQELFKKFSDANFPLV
ncbi:hypothetical protein SAMN05216357_11290 [Porphyromonadaceae bacterium KH3CP3RA]|nr:hypothetical protein SAMN05216357_11290 [Porphyromonadaceae bacterium KH3CP3RA]